MSPGDPAWLFALQFLPLLALCFWLLTWIVRAVGEEARESSRRGWLALRDRLARDIERQELEETLSRANDPKSGGHHG